MSKASDAVAKRPLSRFDYALGLVPFAVLAFARAGDFAEGDTFWGVRAGQQMLAEHTVHLHDLFSWTRAGQPWHPNEWGYDVTLWLAYRLDGLVGLQLLVAAAIVLLGAVVLAAVRAFGGAAKDVFWIALFGSPVLLDWLSARAQTVSYGVQLLELLVLARLFAARGRAVWRWAAALLVLQVVWVNVHEAALGGVVVAVGGVAVRGVTLIRRRELSGRAAALLSAGPVLVLVGSFGGPFGWQVIANSEHTQAESAGVITEWKSILSATAIERAEEVAGLLLLLAVVAVWRRERGTPREALADVWLGAALVLFTGSLFAVRFIALVLLVEIVSVAALARSGRLSSYVSTRRGLLNAGATVVALALVIVGVHQVTIANEPTASHFPSAKLVDEVPAECRLLNVYNDGGWISLLRWPAIRVSQDGRNVLYGKALLEREDALLAGRLGVAGVERFGATCVLAAPTAGIVHELAVDPGWALAARDSKRVLYERRPDG